MKFEEAFNYMRDGAYMQRMEWRPNKRVYVAYNVGGFPFLEIRMDDGRFNAYVPSQCDLFAEDWIAVAKS